MVCLSWCLPCTLDWINLNNDCWEMSEKSLFHSFPSTIPLWCLQLHRELCLLCTHVQNISISKIRRFFSYSGNRRRISIGKGTLSLSLPPEWGDERPSKHVKTPMRFGGFVLQASFLLFRLGFLGLSWDVRFYVRKGKGNEKRKRKSKKGRGKEEER